MKELELRRASANITVLIPTSSIPSHPDTRIIEETINSVRTHLPYSEIILMIDGIRTEQNQRTDQYNEYIRRLLHIANKQKCYPLIFDEHQHQANMTREALKHVTTPLILFVEHDTPITPDREIPFQSIANSILSGQADLVRLHHEALILDVHKYLMFDLLPVEICGIPMMRTQQWSQRPHVTSVAFYKRILSDYFNPGMKTMIEDKMYGVVEQACKDGLMGWYNFRLWIYTPDGDIKRSYHTDGREGEPKYESTFGI